MDPVLKRGAIFNPDETSSSAKRNHWGKGKGDSAPPPMYLWCGRCERTFRRGEYRLAAGTRICPYVDCLANASKEAMDWDFVRVGTDYPRHPQEGQGYAARWAVAPWRRMHARSPLQP